MNKAYWQERREQLLHELRKAVNVVIAETLAPQSCISSDTKGAAALCTAIEAILSHGFKIAGISTRQ